MNNISQNGVLKGFRANKQDSKKQVQSQNDKLKQDLHNLFDLSKIILNRQNTSEAELKDWLLTVDFKISAILQLLVSEKVFTEDHYKATFEDHRVKYLTEQEFQEDLALKRTNSNEPAKKGDTVVLAVEAFDSSKTFILDLSTRYSATVLGSGFLFQEIDDAVVGMTAGEAKPNILVDVGGQQIDYTVTLLRVKGTSIK